MQPRLECHPGTVHLEEKQTVSMAMLGNANIKGLETLVKQVEHDVAMLKTKV